MSSIPFTWRYPEFMHSQELLEDAVRRRLWVSRRSPLSSPNYLLLQHAACPFLEVWIREQCRSDLCLMSCFKWISWQQFTSATHTRAVSARSIGFCIFLVCDNSSSCPGSNCFQFKGGEGFFAYKSGIITRIRIKMLSGEYVLTNGPLNLFIFAPIISDRWSAIKRSKTGHSRGPLNSS